MNELMLNLHEFLKQSEPFLRKTNNIMGYDGWDDFSEMSFTQLVRDPFKEEAELAILWDWKIRY